MNNLGDTLDKNSGHSNSQIPLKPVVPTQAPSTMLHLSTKASSLPIAESVSVSTNDNPTVLKNGVASATAAATDAFNPKGTSLVAAASNDIEMKDKPSVLKTSVVSTNVAATDAVKPEDSEKMSSSSAVAVPPLPAVDQPLQADSNVTQISSLSAVTVPSLPPGKRKSSQTDTINGKEALLNGKKQKIEVVPITPVPVPAPDDSKNSQHMPVTLAAPRAPIPLSSTAFEETKTTTSPVGDNQSSKALEVLETGKASLPPPATETEIIAKESAAFSPIEVATKGGKASPPLVKVTEVAATGNASILATAKVAEIATTRKASSSPAKVTEVAATGNISTPATAKVVEIATTGKTSSSSAKVTKVVETGKASSPLVAKTIEVAAAGKTSSSPAKVTEVVETGKASSHLMTKTTEVAGAGKTSLPSPPKVESTADHQKEKETTVASSSGNKRRRPEETNNNADEIVSQFTSFPSFKRTKDVRPLRSLTTSERIELERLFDFDKRKTDGKTWDDDWFGVLDLLNFEVQNPDNRQGERQKKRSLIEWVGLNTIDVSDGTKKSSTTNNSLRLLNNLLRHVYNYKKVPQQAKRVLANTNLKDPASIGNSIQRLSIDPIILRQDGWTTKKTKEPEGASGGAFRIGEKLWWQGYLGVVIAFVHDNEIGDLWKAIWIEDLMTFDLEPEELEDSRKKYERKKAASAEKKQQLIHKALKNDFQVAGIEHGIVQATSYARGARHGVFWPARVLHASELVGFKGRRNRSKKKVDVVFLAPYWNGDQTSLINGAIHTEPSSSTIASNSESLFSSGFMFEIESIDANDSCIQSYPYDAEIGLDIDSLRSTFKFMGLPKAAFSRFLDSHRLALGFKTFSQIELKSTLASESDRTSAALLEGHPLAVQAPHFPSSVLQLPFIHILSQLPHHERKTSSQTYNDASKGEPALRFDLILEAMKPPICWGLKSSSASYVKETPQLHSSFASPLTFLDKKKGTKSDPHNTGRFLTGLVSLQSLLSDNSPTSRMLKNNLNELVSAFAKNPSLKNLQKSESKKAYVKSLNRTWVVVKSKGETLILVALKHKKFLPFLKDWRRCCERIYKHINVRLGSNGKSWVITDSRCNLHLTSTDCFERAVRLPAALKGVRMAMATSNIEMINTVEDAYLDLAENDVITRAHDMAYIQKIKKRCMAAPEDDVVALTDDSDGNGGEDTKGAKGSWNAALLGVGAALKGLDMIFSGECLNVFCATRPPGHHAGRKLHAMKAVSNGFCLLNGVACAALYATAPIADGGLGLSRVCVIDIDVHHGNGTQDVLCPTYDPRFLYVSMHAGGPDINGLDIEDDELELVEHHLGGNPTKGIFPGRCGDTSPHKGVLNIPLGGQVTSHALGTALVTKVTPAVDAFSPEVIIISAGFDAHINDPLNLGGLTAEDFGTLTEVICKLAYKCCSGRVLSVMEGGYGVPCCRPQNFAKDTTTPPSNGEIASPLSKEPIKPKQQEFVELQCLDLGSDLPSSMTDVISSYALQKRLDKCHQEGFVHCVKEHVNALARCNVVKR